MTAPRPFAELSPLSQDLVRLHFSGVEDFWWSFDRGVAIGWMPPVTPLPDFSEIDARPGALD